MPTGLENELLNDSTVGDLPAEEEVVTYNGNREYDAGPNTGQYGFVEVEIDGEMRECTNAYMSNAYGGQYCVGDSYEDPNGGTQIIRSINPTGLDLAPAQWDAEETYADAGEKMGMTLEEWTEFSAEVQALNETVDGLKGNMFGPTEQERGRLGIRISQANPDWTEEQVMAEADRMLEEKWQTSEAYAEAAAAETALFEKYGIQKENPGVYGSGIYVDSDGKYHKFESSSGNYYQTSQDTSFLDVAVPIGIAIGAGIISGGAASAITSGATAALGSTAAGAINGVLGSAISQGIVTGGIDPSSLLTAALVGGIGGLANAAVDGKLPPSMDEAVWDMADTLKMDYDEVVDMLAGVASGAVSGADLESIALGAVGTMGQAQIMDMLEKSFGDTLNVDDLFKDGQSHIPIEALEPIIGGTIQAAINGGMSEQDALKMAFDYFQAGGDIDFLLPGAVDGFKDWVNGLPGLDFEKDDNWDISFDEESNDWVINHNLPSIDLGDGVELPDLPDTPDVLECMEGWEWSDLYGECVEKINDDWVPDVLECMEGFEWDGQQCVKIDIDALECMEGWEWSDLYGKCVEKIPDDVDALQCMEGWEWSDLYGECVEKIPDDVDALECMEGWEWSDLYGECVEKIPDDVDAVECMEGWEWSDLYGECVEKIKDDVTIETPEVDIPLPEIELGGGGEQGDFTAKWSELNPYTTITNPLLSPYAPKRGK